MTTKTSATASIPPPARLALRLTLAAALAASLLAPRAAPAFDLAERGALWQVVNKLCLPMHATLGLALPCLDLDEKRGFLVIRAPGDTTRIIVVPTTRLEGIESPALLRDDAPNYWAYAWEERGRVADAAPRKLGWGDIGMAINSRDGRTQDQMHIHVDCLDARLKPALAEAKLSTQRWTTINLKPWGRYHAKRLQENGLEHNPFQVVAKEIPGAKADMGRETIAVAGVSDPKGGQGFVLLVKGAGGTAEELLDHRCRERRG